MFMPFILKNS